MIRLAVRCRPELAERVLAELVELAPGGVEEERGAGYVEYAVYGYEGELPAMPELEALAGEALVDVRSTEIPDDWADRWQDFHEPTLIADRIWVRPSWAPARADTLDVTIDPGQAFGTGAHATTRMCIELLAGLAGRGEAGGPFADWGTGSGVLAITAARLGWSPVLGCDHERAALEAAASNAARNDVTLQLGRVNLREDPPPAAPTATANLTAPTLLAIAEHLRDAPSRLICSGLLANETPRVEEAFARHGLETSASLRSGEWEAVLLSRRGKMPV